MKVYILSINETGKCIYSERDLDMLLEDLKTMEEGDESKIEIGDMTQEDLDNLPEFEGW